MASIAGRFKLWAFLHQRQIERWKKGGLLFVALLAVCSGAYYSLQRRAADVGSPETGRLADQSSGRSSPQATSPPLPGQRTAPDQPAQPERASQDVPAAIEASAAERVLVARETGRYDEAYSLLDQGLAVSPSDPALLQINRELRQDLQLGFDFFYLREQKWPILRGNESSEVVLRPGDAYYLTLRTSALAYLYVLQVSSTGTMTVLCPNRKYVPNANPVPPGKYRVPDGYGFLRVAPDAGTERLYVVAARWRQAVLEQLIGRVASEVEPAARTRVIEELTTRLELERRATDTLPGLSFGTYAFRSAGSGGELR